MDSRKQKKLDSKISRKTSGELYSQIQSENGKKFFLMAGKKRENAASTFLGEGCYGSVKLAKDEKEQVLAVKIIPVTLSPTVKGEFDCLTRLGRNPTLVVLPKKSYIFQPVALGREVSKYIFEIEIQIASSKEEKKVAQWELAFAKLCLKIVQQVELMHLKGVYHRDLHLGNILYDDTQDMITIIDFGQGRVAVKEDSLLEINDWQRADYGDLLAAISENVRTIFAHLYDKIIYLLNILSTPAHWDNPAACIKTYFSEFIKEQERYLGLDLKPSQVGYFSLKSKEESKLEIRNVSSCCVIS